MGIKFFRKSYCDISNIQASITITDTTATNDGQDFANFMRNRNNTSGWGTSGSNDAANTELIVDFGSHFNLGVILLLKHNLKAYTIQYLNSISELYQNFSIPVNETNNANINTHHTFEPVYTRAIKIIITGTITADVDKLIAQIITTELLGEMNTQPKIQPIFDRSRRSAKYLSGKRHISFFPTSFSVRVSHNNVLDTNDLDLVETLMTSYVGFLVWICGGDTTQYLSQRFGYRLEDLFLCNIENEYDTEWEESRYANGMGFDLRLREIV